MSADQYVGDYSVSYVGDTLVIKEVDELVFDFEGLLESCIVEEEVSSNM